MWSQRALCSNSAGNILVATEANTITKRSAVTIFDVNADYHTDQITQFITEASVSICDVGQCVRAIATDKENRIVLGGTNQRVYVLAFS